MNAQNPSLLPLHDLRDLRIAVIALARQAGDAIMAVYATDFTVQDKSDTSPVTAADTQAEAVILAGLARLTPQIPVVSEEAAATGRLPSFDSTQRFWLVDPLDGTKEFIQRNGEFTVNIALIENHQPVLGVVLAPALGKTGRLYSGARGLGAQVEDEQGCRALQCRVPPEPARGMTIVASRSHNDAAALDAFFAERQIKVDRLVAAGSSLKLCLVAAGEADLYPRLGRTMEWDIAAGHAVLAAAGGQVLTLSGATLTYGKAGLENPHFVASVTR